MKSPEPKKPQPDDLPAFVEAYFQHLQFAPHVPKEFHTFLKSHLNAFALTMRAKYRPAFIAAESAVEDIEVKAPIMPGNFTMIDDSKLKVAAQNAHDILQQALHDVKHDGVAENIACAIDRLIDAGCGPGIVSESVNELAQGCNDKVADLRKKGVL